MYKKLILSTALLLPKLALAAYFGNDCGENCSWTLDDNGLLTISGNGDMYNFEEGQTPWSKQISSITKIVIEPGITSVGDRAFRAAANVQQVSIPDGVKSLGLSAFYKMPNVVNLNIPDSVEYVGDYAFGDMNKLESIYLSNPNISYGTYPFYGHGADAFCPENSTCQTTRQVSVYTSIHIYTQDAQTGVYSVDGHYYASPDDMLINNSCGANDDGTPSKQCVDDALAYKYSKAKLMAKSKILCQTTAGCLKLLDMAQQKTNCATIATCKTYADENGILFNDPNIVKNADGSSYIYNEDGELITIRGKKVYTVEEAETVTKDGDRFHVFLTYK